jgi:hypothetical protein
MYIKNDTNISIDLISHKSIENNIPYSNNVNSRIFSTLLDDNRVVASYKMYWLLGILDEACSGKEEIEFRKIISRMIAYAWYPTLQFKLNFGRFDNLKKIINYIFIKYEFATNCDERSLIEFLYNSCDPELNKMMKELTLNVPYRLIAPFFADELRGVKDGAKSNMLTNLSLNNHICLYKIIKGTKDKIILNEGWGKYLKDNYKIVKFWIYYKLVGFLQKRNPNVPAIAFKLEAPRNRNLTSTAKLWSEIVGTMEIKDIYSGKEFNEINYGEYGVLSIDHFIPWSFVLHDEMWNLVPTFKNLNSKKNDKLLPFDKYVDNFCNIQYKAFSYMCNNKINHKLEEYIDILKLDNPYDFYKNSSNSIFNFKLKQCISPLYQIAENQGFQIINSLF